MEYAVLGRTGLRVSRVGCGGGGIGQVWGPTTEAESVRTIHRALELGVYDLESNKRLFAKADPAPDAPAGCRSRMRCGTARGVAAPAPPAPQSPQCHPAATAASG